MKTYIGDSVYAEWRGQLGELILTTEDGNDIPSNKIVLGQEEREALVRFIEEAVPKCSLRDEGLTTAPKQ